MINSEAGPSKLPRKPSAPHPTSNHENPSSSSSARGEKRKLKPPLPLRPTKSSHPSASASNGKSTTLPLKTLQGVSKVRSDSTKDGFGREVIFVTRKTGLGMLLGRCRSLVVDEGYSSLRFHAIGAAIPQALLLLHALLDLLPYPVGERGMWYEIKTGSVECIDEISGSSSKPKSISESSSNVIPGQNEQGKVDGIDPSGEEEEEEEAEEDGLDWLNDIGAVEEDTPVRKSRIKSTIQIDLHISPRPSTKRKSDTITNPKPNDPSSLKKKKVDGKVSTRNRPSKKKRQQLANQRHSLRNEEEAMNVEEELMNIDNTPEGNSSTPGGKNGNGVVGEGSSDTEEEIEEIEMR